MAVMKSEPDGKHPASHYLVVPDPQQVSGWALRYKDAAGNVDHRLAGACWAALHGGYRGQKYQGPDKGKALSKLIAIYKAQGWDLPTADSSADDGEPDPTLAVFDAAFDAAPAQPADVPGADTEMVTRRGLIFEAGFYPDKDFSLSPDEMAEAAAAFQPVKIDLEHVPSVLDGRLGELTSVTLSEDGAALIGEARLPKWLDDVLADGERKVSAAWDRTTKKLRGLALVRNPRVSDAALMAAFAGTAHKTASGQAALQRIHDIATDNGAVCRRDSAATMASRSEAGAMQQVHDMVVGQGAECEPAYAGSPRQASRTEPFSQPPPKSPPRRGKKGHRMNIKEWILGKAQEDGVEVTEDDLTAAFAASGEPGPDLETVNKAIEQAVKDRDAKIAALEAANQAAAAEFSRMAGERRRSDAVTFADSKVATHRVPPACAPHLADLAERIAATDSTANFGDGEQPSMTLLAAFVDSLPDMSLFTRPQVAGQSGAVFANQEKTKGLSGQPDEPDEDRIKDLLSKSTLGRVIVKERARAQNGK